MTATTGGRDEALSLTSLFDTDWHIRFGRFALGQCQAKVEFFDDYLRRIEVDPLVDGGHDAVLHELANQA